MTASELITRLQQLIAEHGDLEVARYDEDYGTFFTFIAAHVDRQEPIRSAFTYGGEPCGPFIGIGQ